MSGILQTAAAWHPASSGNGLLTGLVSYYKCDEASGDLIDAHGSNTATETGTVASGTGIINGARDFDRAVVDNRFVKTSPTGLDNQNVSVSLWLNPESQGDYYNPFVYTATDSWANGYGFYLEGGFLKFWVQNYATTPAVATAMSNGTWYHIVGVYDNAATELKMYVNGTETDNNSRTATLTFASAVMEVGSGRNVAYDWNGLIDEIAIFSRAISSSDVTTIYNGGACLPYGSYTS